MRSSWGYDDRRGDGQSAGSGYGGRGGGQGACNGFGGGTEARGYGPGSAIGGGEADLYASCGRSMIGVEILSAAEEFIYFLRRMKT